LAAGSAVDCPAPPDCEPDASGDADDPCDSEDSLAAPLLIGLWPALEDAVGLFAELPDDVADEVVPEDVSEVVFEVAPVDEEKFDVVLSDGGSFEDGSFEEMAVGGAASDALSFELFGGLLVDSSDGLDAASDETVANGLEYCELEYCESGSCERAAGCPARCSASSKPPNALSADDDPRPADACPTGG
jgi:hypothetical protein